VVGTLQPSPRVSRGAVVLAALPDLPVQSAQVWEHPTEFGRAAFDAPLLEVVGKRLDHRHIALAENFGGLASRGDVIEADLERTALDLTPLERDRLLLAQSGVRHHRHE